MNFSSDQSRSFASTLHDIGKDLQYFSLDFNEEPSSLHASYILKQALFTNIAIKKILSIYGDTI